MKSTSPWCSRLIRSETLDQFHRTSTSGAWFLNMAVAATARVQATFGGISTVTAGVGSAPPASCTAASICNIPSAPWRRNSFPAGGSASPRPVRKKQCATDLGFQLAQRPRQGGLRCVEAGRRAGDKAMLCHGTETPQMAHSETIGNECLGAVSSLRRCRVKPNMWRLVWGCQASFCGQRSPARAMPGGFGDQRQPPLANRLTAPYRL